jgi:hypothetical protein
MGAVVDEFTSVLGFRVYFIQKEDVNGENEIECRWKTKLEK